MQDLWLPAATTAALHAFASTSHVTFNTLIQGAWALLLSRYSGERDIVFGVIVSGRPAALTGIESMVGLFINTLPVRLRVSDETPLLAWLQGLQEQQVEARQYDYSSLAQIQTWSDVPRGQPLFHSVLSFENYTPELAHTREQSLKMARPRLIDRSNYPLTLAIAPGTQLFLRAIYDCSRYQASGMARMLQQMRTLLEGFLAHPQARLGEISLLSPVEMQQALTHAHGPLDTSDPSLSAPALFLLHASRTPDTVALVSSDLHLTYHSLTLHAHSLASLLRARHIGPDSLLALALHRSPLWLLSLLASWLAGAAYLPLDPSAPPARLHSLLEQNPPALLLTSRDLLPTLSDLDLDLDLLCLPDALPVSDPCAPLPPPPALHPASLAYQLVTSGSTGLPKPVLLSHRSLANLAIQQGRRLAIRPGQRVLQWAAASFDASLSEIVLALLHGATLCLPDSPGPLVGPALHNTLAHLAITTLTLPPSALSTLSLADLPDLHHLLIAGEAWTDSLLGTAPPDLHIFNAYGPSEACVCASMSRWQGEARPDLGEPLGHTHLFVLDPGLRPTPPGGLGEIYLGGVGLARGYGGLPALTAERFVPDPFSAQPGSRLYRTGDLACIRQDGSIAYRGRADQQVKLRGYRIEPGEVEHALRAQEGVREAVVVVQGEGERRQLVAYVQGEIAVGQVRAGVGQVLPGYLQPGRYIVCTQWPLTSSGKVDRQALARGWEDAHEAEEMAAEEEAEAGSEMEQRVAVIWREVLGVRRVGRQESFFEVGGHSLLAVRLLARVRSTLEVDLGLDRFFEAPTIAGLAREVEGLIQQEQRERARLASLLQDLEQLSDDEVIRRLSGKQDGATL